MTEQGPQTTAAREAIEAQRLAGVVLVRIATDPSDEASVARDLAPILGARSSNDLWRIELGRLIAALVAGGLGRGGRPPFQPPPPRLLSATPVFGGGKRLPANLGTARDTHLVAKALDLTSGPAARLKLLRKADGLRSLIVAQHWQLRIKGQPSAQRLRAALAVKALGRAFGNQVGTGVGDKSSLPAKAGRLLAAQLSASGREFSSDARLVAALAPEAVGPRRSDLQSLQMAGPRRFLGRTDSSGAKRSARLKIPPARRGNEPARLAHATDAPHQPAAAPASYLSTVPPDAAGIATPPSEMERPSPSSFAAAVHTAANETAEGWAGNRKAFISKVWAIIRERHAAWDLTEIEFKCMLTEAHRTGLVALANADLKDKRALKELNDSAVIYKNTVWHYVRAID